MSDSSQPLLRTLSPALRELERRLKAWLSTPHRFPVSTLQKATLEGIAADLQRQADALEITKPLLVIILMGGTGVGKSTLLNALAGGAVAQASFTRPTTRDPVVYYHESIQPARFDKALKLCKLVSHDRLALEQKILVDTPDLDSNDLANREKLMQILPVADIVLYVGSQEKYHDRLGWELFLEQRRRRAFAFVLNKWDRCQQNPGATGARPDEDLLRDLNEQGFKSPLLFRTCAQHWVDHPPEARNGEGEKQTRRQEDKETGRQGDGEPSSSLSPCLPVSLSAPLPDGEGFLDLVAWLEKGITRLEIEAIKARGVRQMLLHLIEALENVRPPDLSRTAAKIGDAWKQPLAEEAKDIARVLLNKLEPYQKEVEHYFAEERQKLFRGVMAGYLYYFNRLKYVGSSVRDRIPFLPRIGQRADAPLKPDLSALMRVCSKAAGEQHLEARKHALVNRLLVEADVQGFPVNLLSDATEAAQPTGEGIKDWNDCRARAMAEVLGQIETVWTRPTGLKRFVQGSIILSANYLPALSCLTMIIILIGQYTHLWLSPPDSLWLLLSPFVVMMLIVVLMHFLIALVLPLNWLAIRADLEKQLENRLREDMEKVYCPLAGEIAQSLLAERQKVENLQGEVREVAGFVEKHERSAGIQDLYGNDKGSPV